MSNSARLWLSRLLIFIVTAWNLQAALAFILWPDAYSPGFELSGLPGATAVRGTGLLFLMWNLPYLVALSHPLRYRLALKLALAMQAIGLAGESLIFLGLTPEHGLLQDSIFRFMLFDAAGLVVLAAALWLVRKELG